MVWPRTRSRARTPIGRIRRRNKGDRGILLRPGRLGAEWAARRGPHGFAGRGVMVTVVASKFVVPLRGRSPHPLSNRPSIRHSRGRWRIPGRNLGPRIEVSRTRPLRSVERKKLKCHLPFTALEPNRCRRCPMEQITVTSSQGAPIPGAPEQALKSPSLSAVETGVALHGGGRARPGGANGIPAMRRSHHFQVMCPRAFAL
jgi:hypothetical protein